ASATVGTRDILETDRRHARADSLEHTRSRIVLAAWISGRETHLREPAESAHFREPLHPRYGEASVSGCTVPNGPCAEWESVRHLSALLPGSCSARLPGARLRSHGAG